MPPYNPPNTHFCQTQAYENKTDNLKIIGPKGSNFIRLTKKLNIQYLWWNTNTNVIEIWGSEEKLDNAKSYLNKYMVRFFQKHCCNDERQTKRLKFS